MTRRANNRNTPHIKENKLRSSSVSRDYITIVSGLPRSGTSLLMSAISAGGIAPLTDHIRTADEDNPNGYFEFEPVKQTKQDPSWLHDATGKVVKMVYRLLYDLPKQHQYRVVFARRNLREVLASQNAMLLRNGEPAGSTAQLRSLFVKELVKCDNWLSSQPNFQTLHVDYKDMIAAGHEQATRINSFLDGGLDVEAMANVVDPALYRNRI